MIKQYTLTQEERQNLLFSKKDSEESFNKEWQKIADERGFDVKTVEFVDPRAGLIKVDFFEKAEEVVEIKAEEPKPEEVEDELSIPSFPTESAKKEEEPAPTEPKEELPENPSIRLKSLVSDNFKKLNIDIQADGRGFEIRGDNGVGKSSVIDAIFTTIQGMTGTDVQAPIQRGKEEALNTVELQLDNDITFDGSVIPKGTIITAARKFTAGGGNRLSVKIDGKTFKSPSEFMKFIVEQSSIADPTTLWSMKPVQLKKYLTQVSGIEEELAAIEITKKEIYDKKYAIERNIEAFKNELELEYADISDDIQEPKFEEIQKNINDRKLIIDETELIKQDLRNNKQSYSSLHTTKEANEKVITTAKEKIEGLELQIAELKSTITNKEDYGKEIQEQIVKNLKEEEEIEKKIAVKESELQVMPDRSNELKTLQDQQCKFLALENKKKLASKINTEMDKQEAIMLEVAEVEDQRKRLFTNAKMPIPGLLITDEGVDYKGVPLTKDQISEAEGLELCMDILIAQKPMIRIIACKYGHAFSDKTLHRVLSKAKYANYQVIIERVSESDKLEIEFLEEVK